MRLEPDILEQSFALVAPRSDQLVARFYDRLFRDYPEVKPLFGNTDMIEQRKKLEAALRFVVANVRNPGELTEALENLAHRHLDYGAMREHYDAFTTTLLLSLAEVAGDGWTEPVGRAWRDALAEIKRIMIEAAYADARHELTEAQA